jgi:putative transposase
MQMGLFSRFNVIIGAVALALRSLEVWGIEQRVELKTTTGTLHGTLDLPNDPSPRPVVLIIAGSGPTDRDGNQVPMRTDSLKLLGHALAANGIASLRYDKRGIAESAAAAPKEEDIRFETYVDDAVQWLIWLHQNSRFLRAGIIGHSEGSLVGMLAAKRANVDAFVSVAGAGRSAHTLMRDQLNGSIPNQQLDLELKTPKQVWVGDITYLKVAGIYRYLAVVMDKYSRRVVGWSYGPRKDVKLALEALNRAVGSRRPSSAAVFHTHRGIEYAAGAFKERIAELGFTQSMNRPGKVTDNAFIESFFHSMKSEVFHGYRFNDDSEVRSVLKDYLPFYNRDRLHSSLDYVSPATFERQAR